MGEDANVKGGLCKDFAGSPPIGMQTINFWPQSQTYKSLVKEMCTCIDPEVTKTIPNSPHTTTQMSRQSRCALHRVKSSAVLETITPHTHNMHTTVIANIVTTVLLS